MLTHIYAPYFFSGRVRQQGISGTQISPSSADSHQEHSISTLTSVDIVVRMSTMSANFLATIDEKKEEKSTISALSDMAT